MGEFERFIKDIINRECEIECQLTCGEIRFIPVSYLAKKDGYVIYGMSENIRLYVDNTIYEEDNLWIDAVKKIVIYEA